VRRGFNVGVMRKVAGYVRVNSEEQSREGISQSSRLLEQDGA
jgi:hypothetical protein